MFYFQGASNRRDVGTPPCDMFLDWFEFSANIKSDISLCTHDSRYKSNQHTRINERKDI